MNISSLATVLHCKGLKKEFWLSPGPSPAIVDGHSCLCPRPRPSPAISTFSTCQCNAVSGISGVVYRALGTKPIVCWVFYTYRVLGIAMLGHRY